MRSSLGNKAELELGNVNPAYVNDHGQSEGVQNKLPAVLSGDKDATEGAEVTDDAPQRQQWSNGVEFLMSCIAMSVGLGNIWRFPFTAYKNGGGAFLIPYIIVLFLIGKPLYYMEMSLGQFAASGAVKVWQLSPALTGLGYGQMFATVIVLTYYCSLMAITCFYFFASFSKDLPWSYCDKSWDMCFDSKRNGSVHHENMTGYKSSSEIYFYKYVLNEKSTIHDGIGLPDWRLTLCLLLSWITIFLVIVRGVKGSGKVAYFLALFPYVVMITLLIRGATLPGAVDGILFFIEPQWESLLNPNVWYAAVTQAFFSLSICFGTLMMYASYNDFQHNVYRDAMIVTSIDTLTSLLAGCTIFSILGNLMWELDEPDITKVVQEGAGLAFVSYPDAISKFEVVPQFFAVVFFLMLYTLGIGSAVALEGAVITIICDQFPRFKYWMVALVTCIIGFLVGLFYITPGGQYVLELVDNYGANFTVFILATIEIVGIAWIYGVDNFCDDVEFMVGRRVSAYWRLSWGFITPVLMIIILVYSLANWTPLTYGSDNYVYPTSAYAAGWVLFLFGVVQFPIWAAIAILRRRGLSFTQMIKSAFQPSEHWRPKSTKMYNEWKEFKELRRMERLERNESIWHKFLRVFFACNPLQSA